MLYEVCAKCGHVGRKYYVEKVFAVIANSKKEAAKIARAIPRVKHDHKDAIIYVKEISKERYDEIIATNDADLYFRCKNKQEQRMIGDIDKIKEPGWLHEDEDTESEYNGNKKFYNGKSAIRHPKKYFNNYIGTFYEWDEDIA